MTEKYSSLLQDIELQQYMNPVPGVKRWVVCAAIRWGDIIITGPRHYSPTMINTMRLLREDVLEKISSIEEEQGFIDQWGNFMSRKEAMECVKESGQPFDVERNVGNLYLFSEGLY